MPSAYPKRKKKQDGPARKASYGRCSSDDQKYKDFSTVQNQHEKNRAYIERTGGIHVGEYSDEGKTGTNLERPDWKRLLADAQAGKFDVVVVTYMSRLGRGDMFTVASYFLQMAGVTVEMVEERYSDDFQGRAQKKLTILLDGMQPEQVSRDTRTKMEGMVAHGLVCGHIPFGYRKEYTSLAITLKKSVDDELPQIMVPDEDAAPIVRQAFCMTKAHSTRAEVRGYLNMVTSRDWSTTQVTELLSDESYLGIYQFGDWRNETHHAAIVERDLWDEVQAILATPPQRPARGRPKKTEDGSAEVDPYRYYLRGRVRCPHCGCIYTQASAGYGPTHYYVCLCDNKGTNKDKGKAKCPVGRVNSDALHYTVLTLIERAARHHTIMHKLIAETGGWQKAPEDLQALRGQLGKQLQFVGARKENLLRALEDGRGTSSINARLDQLEKDERALKEKIGIADADIAAATVKRPTAEQVMTSWGSVLEVWPDLDEDERSDLLSVLVQEVVIQTKDRVLLRLTPIAEVHGHLLAINSQMGADSGRISTRPATRPAPPRSISQARSVRHVSKLPSPSSVAGPLIPRRFACRSMF